MKELLFLFLVWWNSSNGVAIINRLGYNRGRTLDSVEFILNSMRRNFGELLFGRLLYIWPSNSSIAVVATCLACDSEVPIEL